MLYTTIKLVISAALIVAIAEISKRSSLIGGLLASLPLTSILAFTWLYLDTKDTAKVSKLSTSIFWLVLPSLSLFITLPIFLKRMNFYVSMGLSIAIMLCLYLVMVSVLGRCGIEL